MSHRNYNTIRDLVEKQVACGRSLEDIAADLRLPLNRVQQIRQAMDTVNDEPDTVPVSDGLPSNRVPRLPCGTHAAFNRHRKRGERIDEACREAEREYRRLRWERQKARAA